MTPDANNGLKNERISNAPWGTFEGKDVFLFRLKNASGAYVELTNYGATLVSVVVPDKTGNLESVVLGFPSLEGYLHDRCYIGSTIGRFANRIGNARFTLDGVTYALDKNDNTNSNHGGPSGFHARVFDFAISDDAVTFMLTSENGEGGFPGKIDFKVKYSWSDDCALAIRFNAVADKRTVLNFTNHAYFNLSPGDGDILNHELTLHADSLASTDKQYIPTGVIAPANDLLFKRHKIRERVKVSDNTMTGVNSYYILNPKEDKILRPAGKMTAQSSGRTLDVFTTYPGVQVYTGDFLHASHTSNLSRPPASFDGLCLECQHYPDAPNHPNFPSTVFDAGQVYDETIVYKFGVTA
ncbi:aldose epimerase family protein [Chryseolinea lacunae]|uniref:Aldose 1-epimerase n=1 Tax=Chryseolinea lacunae TaxID=2801331 RepID=A0ABS1L1E5_9BACT|nr:aldose epimerase family protein [Chryseolinea lacunae]MBL0745515.1 galactose mutarotase [Chryseolinea lacunae]